MKKGLLLILVLVFSCWQVIAQSKFEPEWNIGVGFGPTFSTMSIIPSLPVLRVKTKTLTQFHGGLSVRYISEKNLGFIAELNYGQMGWEGNYQDQVVYSGGAVNTDVNTEDFAYTRKLNYIEIPFLTHIYFGSNKFRGFINIGPQIGYLVSESETINDNLRSWLDSEPDPDQNAVGHYGKKADKKIDYGLTAGLGVELRTGLGNFALEGRYYMGFGDIYNSRKSDYFSRSANRVISARLTYFVKAF